MRIAVDTGGTFTDCVFVRDGRLEILKVPSTPSTPAEAISRAVRGALQSSDDRGGLDLICGTTVGTNALLERRGGRVILVTTAGFEDVLEIGRQARPQLYNFFTQKPEPLVPRGRRLGVAERLGADGAIVTGLTAREVRRVVRKVAMGGPDSVAVCLLFSFRNSRHEQEVAAALRKAGYLVSVSHEILPEFREYERTSTTVINAYLAPVMSEYLRQTQERMEEHAGDWNGKHKSKTGGAKRPGARVRVMQSNGGIISAEQAAREPVRTLLSGPAGGAIGAQYAASRAGIEKIISFDMGGTSTDVALIAGEIQTTGESVVGGNPVSVPMLEIHTVGAGGGSLARFDHGGALRVGPQSAGAEPGPICYGRGKHSTVTDAHAVLGHLGEEGLLGGAFKLNIARAKIRMERERGAFTSVEEFASGIIAVANAVMEKAIRVISVERGHDTRDYALVAFGGAGGLHACDLAAALDMGTVLVPIFPGALSALGILRADVAKEFTSTMLLGVEGGAGTARSVENVFRSLEVKAQTVLREEGFRRSKMRMERRLEMRYSGQAYELSVPAAGDFVAAFHEAHERRYGYHNRSAQVEIVLARLRAAGIVEKPAMEKLSRAGAKERPRARSVRSFLDGKWLEAKLYAREELKAGHRMAGPAIISEYSATTLVPGGWLAAVDNYGQILLTRGDAIRDRHIRRKMKRR